MLNSVFVLQIKHILTKKNFEMYFRAGKTNKFSVFHVENGEIQSLWLYVCFNSVNVMALCIFQFRNTCNLA